MFILTDGKLYLQKGDKLVGVDVSPLGCTEVDGTEIEKPDSNYRSLELFEVRAKFQINEENHYKFPRESGEESIEDLREKAKQLGIKFSGNTGVKTLKKKISEKEAE